MNATPVIAVENVSKRFPTGDRSVSLRQEAASLLRGLAGKRARRDPEGFWALREVSFSVKQGEAVGIIGRNGAGKTTLLRILSGITSPTTGQVSVNGQFATLIALSAGFHPERTGRENIYLNAAIQGVNPAQIEPLVPSILEFAELGGFIDEPVKRYSTGMTARLGFSIAIHILPDILFLDEVLSVGDPAFQEKCKARIHQFLQQGRTLLFVSHSMPLVRQMCQRCIWLQGGRLVMDGPAETVIPAYEQAIHPAKT